MKSAIRLALAAVVGFLLLASAPDRASAQEAGLPRRQQVLSVNPFGLLLEFFNAEYERTISASSTAGLGGSFVSAEGDDYINADVFWRYYPGGEPLRGWAFGFKAGVTNVMESGTFFGYGFDLNRSWLTGRDDRFYVGLGFGLKRLVGADSEDFGLEVIPTIRLVNIGIAF